MPCDMAQFRVISVVTDLNTICFIQAKVDTKIFI